MDRMCRAIVVCGIRHHIHGLAGKLTWDIPRFTKWESDGQ